MTNCSAKPILVLIAFLLFGVVLIVFGQEPPAQKPPANVARKWTIYSTAANGESATKFIELKQNGNGLTGHFKGPDQSGGLEGTIKEQHIVFRTKTRWVFVFRGRVDGNTMQGTFHDRRGTGQWQAVRQGALAPCDQTQQDCLSTP